VIALLIAAALASPLPDPSLTPGVRNPAVTQDNIADTICKDGWTSTVRPPVSYTRKLKSHQMAERGLSGSPRAWEEDHFLPLELGGDPTSPQNLWPQPWKGPCGAHAKDRTETLEKRLVCSGAITLAQAQAEMLADWTAVYRNRIGPLECKIP